MNPENSTPPQFPLRLFRWFCRPELVEDIEGDLVEKFHRNVEETGMKKAKNAFTWQVILLLPMLIPLNRLPLMEISPTGHPISPNTR